MIAVPHHHGNRRHQLQNGRMQLQQQQQQHRSAFSSVVADEVCAAEALLSLTPTTTQRRRECIIYTSTPPPPTTIHRVDHRPCDFVLPSPPPPPIFPELLAREYEYTVNQHHQQQQYHQHHHHHGIPPPPPRRTYLPRATMMQLPHLLQLQERRQQQQLQQLNRLTMLPPPSMLVPSQPPSRFSYVENLPPMRKAPPPQVVPAVVTCDSSTTDASASSVAPPSAAASLCGWEEGLDHGGISCSNRSTCSSTACTTTCTPSTTITTTTTAAAPATTTSAGTSAAACDMSTSSTSNQDGDDEGYYLGNVSLALDSDEDFLSPLHSFMRRYCVEAFSATNDDVQEPSRGPPTHSSHPQNGRRVVGQVGIRCIHCKHRPYAERQERAVCFPSSLNKIYHSIETWQRRHSVACQDIPLWVKKSMIELMQKSKSGAGGRRQYWEESARRVGMADTANGIRFIRPPGTDATAAAAAATCSPCFPPTASHNDENLKAHNRTMIPLLLEDEEPGRPVVKNEDRRLVTDYLFLLLEQMETCRFTEEDRSGGRSKIKNVPVGMPGIRCKHCGGKAGFGRYFPTSVVALTSANSDRNIFNHLVKCRRCPRDIQEELIQYRNEHQQFKSKKNRRGSRKLFFKRVWSRLHHQSSYNNNNNL